MIFRNLTQACDTIQISNGVTAGTTDTQVFTEVNMKGQFDSVFILVNLGAVTSTASGTLRARGSATSGGEGTTNTVNCFIDPLTINPPTNNTGTIMTSVCGTGDSNTVLTYEIHRFQQQYMKAELVRATANIVILAATAILFNSHTAPWLPTGTASNGTGTYSNLGYCVCANATLSTT